MRRLALVVSIALLQSDAGWTQELPDPPPVTPTARDLYIGCNLFVRGEELAYGKRAPPYSALACSLVAFNAFGYSRKIKPGNEWEYCIPENAATAADPMQAMATQYLDFYERYGFRDPNKQGLTMMLYAFKVGWPCR